MASSSRSRWMPGLCSDPADPAGALPASGGRQVQAAGITG